MWVGSMRSPTRTSANEELGTVAENNPLTENLTSSAHRQGYRDSSGAAH